MAAGGLSGRDAGHDFVRHAGRFERGELFGEPGEDRGVAPFEPHDGAARAGVRGPSRSLISVCDISRPWPWRPRQTSSASGRVRVQQLGSGEVVVEHDVGRAEAFGAAQREQPGIAGAGADEIHFADVCGHAICDGERWLAGMTFST